MEAIKYILTQIRSSARPSKKIVIFCDSKSVLESIEIQESKNPVMTEILDLLQHLVRENFIVEFVGYLATLESVVMKKLII